MEDSMEDAVRICTLNIEGMVCRSCVNNIQSNVSTKLGIVSAKVNLENKLGRFEYDPSVVAPGIIQDYIEDMGFDASFNHLGTFGSAVSSTLRHRKGTKGALHDRSLYQVWVY